MAHLNLALLGPFRLTLEHPIFARIESDKTRGLLAVEHDRPHLRAALAELLWPDHSEQAATANFRRILANLRAVLDDRDARVPHLRITRTTVQFDPASDAFVDVVRVRDLLETPATAPMWAEHMELAIALYRGPFLEGFTLHGCPEFEQWVVEVRSELDRLVGEALHGLADHCWDQEDIGRALALYRRSLLLAPYHEVVHRKIMLAYAAATGDSIRRCAIAFHVHWPMDYRIPNTSAIERCNGTAPRMSAYQDRILSVAELLLTPVYARPVGDNLT